MVNSRRYEVKVDADELIDNDLEGFLDLLSRLATGTELLMDINWEIIGVEPKNILLISVIGDPSMIEEEE